MRILMKLFLCSAVLLFLASPPIKAEDPQYAPFGTLDPFGSEDPFGDPHSPSYNLYGGPNAITDEVEREQHHEPYH